MTKLKVLVLFILDETASSKSKWFELRQSLGKQQVKLKRSIIIDAEHAALLDIGFPYWHSWSTGWRSLIKLGPSAGKLIMQSSLFIKIASPSPDHYWPIRLLWNPIAYFWGYQILFQIWWTCSIWDFWKDIIQSHYTCWHVFQDHCKFFKKQSIICPLLSYEWITSDGSPEKLR